VASDTVEDLKRLLRNKFPQAHLRPLSGDVPETTFRFSDPLSFPAGGISEIVPEGPEPILGLVLANLLGEPEAPNGIPDFILVDGDGFDPGSFTNEACSRLLWVRCETATELLKSADLLIRDGNIPFVLLDTCGFPAAELRALPSSAWWRLKQMTERHGSRLLVLSAFPLIPCATLRLSLSSRLTLADFDRPRGELLEKIHIRSQRLRHAT
jgi:hypothetical protein